jgi:molybdopterin/thiamine biosynthesis adenylyltransferase
MAHVLVVGVGAVGSHLAGHLARCPQVSRMTVIDRDRYEVSNLRGQDIDTRDLGRPKASVQARRLTRINPKLAVTAIHKTIEDLPLGALRANVILACLDSRRARLVINQAAWRLGIPWIDAGVAGAELLARVQVFVPATDAPCLECGWDPSDYAIVEQTYACQGEPQPVATDTPSALAALAAALQAVECEKLLAGGVESLAGHDVLIDARHHKHYLTSFRRNPACRMPDHDGWRIDKLGALPRDVRLDELIALGSTLRGADEKLELSIAGQRMARTLICRRCDCHVAAFTLERAVRRKAPVCSRCGDHFQPDPFDLHDSVPLDSVDRATTDPSLSQVGLLPGDVISIVTSSVQAHYELDGRS